MYFYAHDCTNLWLSFSIPTKNCVKAQITANCKTAGSINQHFGKNRLLQPENFNIEIYLKFNLGPLHLLDNFVKEILAFDSTKSYLRKEQYKIGRLEQECGYGNH